MSRAWRRGAGAGVAWLVLWGLWLLLAGSASPAELLVGAGAAALVLAGSRRVVRVLGIDLAPRAAWLGEVRRVPLAVARDAALVLRTVAGRPPDGGIVRRRLAPLGDERRERARGVVLTVLLSIAPNTIVIGVDRGELVVHQLLPRHSELEVDLR